MMPDLLIEFLVSSFYSGCANDILGFTHRFSLDLRRDRVVLRDLPNDVVSILGIVAIANHLCTLVEGRFEEGTSEFALDSFTDIARSPTPHIGDENEVLQGRVIAKFTEDPEIPSGYPGNPLVGDAVDIDDPRKLGPFPVPVQKFGLEGRKWVNINVHSRDGQESCNHVRDIRIVL